MGKSTFANRLQSKFFRETYYPTHKSTVLLFNFQAKTDKAKAILDEYGGLSAKQLIAQNNDIQLSPLLFQSYNKAPTEVRRRRSSASSRRSSASSTGNLGRRVIKNKYYSYKFLEEDETYVAPEISPISVELIDTPPFKPHLVVPFLEVSLYRNLDKDDLHNLANEPRKPVSTNPLLVASGASELDGNVNGYIFMYCAVPSLNPPAYEEVLVPTSSSNSVCLSPVSSRSEESLSVLELIRGAILDAWREYRNYQKKWAKGKEGDVYSLVYGIKQLWKMKNHEEEQNKLEELRNISSHLDELTSDPSSPDAPPPIIIVCTHAKHEGASPLLIENGKKMANQWKSSFILIDNEFDENVQETISLVIRELLEREKLQKLKKKLWA